MRDSVPGLLVALIATIVVVAAGFPWYAAWVDRWMLERELTEFASTLEQEKQADAANARQRLAREAQARRTRQMQSVRISGFATSGGVPSVVADLAGLSLEAARPILCAHVAAHMQRARYVGEVRIQQDRGSRPARALGSIHC